MDKYFIVLILEITVHQNTRKLVFYFLSHKQTKIRIKEAIDLKFKTNKEKGNSGLGMAIAYFTTKGYIVSIPLNDTQDYDLIVEKNAKLQRVQVKSTGCIGKGGNYQVALKSCGGTRGKTYKTIIDTNVELIFILTEKKEINNVSTLSLCDKYGKYRIKIV